MNKYSLIVVSEGKEIEIIIKNDKVKSTKLDLRCIDLYTTKFNCKDDLLYDIHARFPDITSIDSIYIKSNRKYVPIAYNDKEVLCKVECNYNKINQDDKNFKSIIYNFLNMLEDNEFYAFLLRSKFINELEKSFIKERIEGGDYSNHLLYQIISSFSCYEDLRKLMFTMDKLNIYILNKQLKEKLNYFEQKNIKTLRRQ